MWAFRRSSPSYGDRLRDWLLRLLCLSAVCLTVGSWPLYWVYSNFWDQMIAGSPLPRGLYLLPAAYLVLPTAAGWIFGHAVNKQWLWASKLAGKDRPPLAWDHLFNERCHGYIRCRLKSDRWVGGYYNDDQTYNLGLASYAAGGGFDDRDLYISYAFNFDQETGVQLHPTGASILIKWSEVEFLEFQELADNEQDQATQNKKTGYDLTGEHR